MTAMSHADTDALWAGIDDQRARTADLLEQLTAQQWELERTRFGGHVI